MNYNYIVFNNPDSGFWDKDKRDGYYNICLRDLERLDNVKVVNYPLDHKSIWIKTLFRLHYRTNMPYKDKWFPYYFDKKFKEEKPLCFVLISNPSLDYLLYIRKNYPNAKIVKFFRDLVSTKQKWYDAYMKAGVIDEWVTYDEEEAQNYNMYYYHEIESKIELDSNYAIKYDVFFAGRAKDRLKKLITVYDCLEAQGIKCYFYLTGVDVKEQMPRDGIEYSDRLLTYREMLTLNTHSRCILELNQDNAVGYTSRFLEAVMYNRKLITDNVSIRKSNFFDERFILCFKNIDDIDPHFILDNSEVDFHYNDEFSPCGFIEYLDGLI